MKTAVFNWYSWRLVPLLLPSVVVACQPAIEGSGVVVSEETELEAFDSVIAENGLEVRLVESDEFSVVVHADDNLIDDIIVEQRGETVRVYLDDLNVVNATLEVDVLLPELKRLRIADATRVEAEDVVTTGSLKLEVEDSSDLRLSTLRSTELAYFELKCEDACQCDVQTHAQQSIVEVRDASNAALRGKSDAMTLIVSDASNMNARSFEVERLNVRVNDASTVGSQVTERAQGKVTDASSLELRGGADVDVEVDSSSHLARD